MNVIALLAQSGGLMNHTWGIVDILILVAIFAIKLVVGML